MHFTAAAIAALSSIAAAAEAPDYPPMAGIWNECDFPTWVWYVGGDVNGPDRNPNGTGYVNEEIRSDPVSGGRAIKIFTEEDGLYTGAPHLNLAYNFEDPLVWYDLTQVFGSPFEGMKLNVSSYDEGCQEIIWEDGVQPAGSGGTKACEAKVGFSITLCDD